MSILRHVFGEYRQQLVEGALAFLRAFENRHWRQVTQQPDQGFLGLARQWPSPEQ
eukprot:gene2133-2426_t